MRSLIIIILASYAVKCDDDASYYVVEVPEADTRDLKPFRVYWNVPTMQCKSKKIAFDNLHEKFGIIQNTGDSFRGDEIAILYDPGIFPALLKNETSGKYKFRNGGVPQEGNLERHWRQFKAVLDQSIPDPDFSGIGIIDFESWRPIFRQNFGVLIPYKDFSYQIERKQHWFWPEKAIQAKAKLRFEEAARSFMQTTLVIAKELRPFARWGYYAFPYCFNMSPNSPYETCPSNVREENDKINWLWQESTALYPSTYFSQNVSAADMARTLRGRIAEAARLSRTAPILPYFWFRYRDGGFLPQEELDAILEIFNSSQASGFIIWGSSSDVNTVEKCKNLLKYTEEILGPNIAKYTKQHDAHSNKVRPVTQPPEPGLITWMPILRDQLANNTSNSFDQNTTYNWIVLNNSTQEINHTLERTKKGSNKTNNVGDKDKYSLHIKRNTLLELLFNILLYKEMEEENNKTVDYDEDVVLPQKSTSDIKSNYFTTESRLPNASDHVNDTSSTVGYTTTDPISATAKLGTLLENDGSNVKKNLTEYVNQKYNVNLYASEFPRPNGNEILKTFSSTKNYSTVGSLNIDSSDDNPLENMSRVKSLIVCHSLTNSLTNITDTNKFRTKLTTNNSSKSDITSEQTHDVPLNTTSAENNLKLEETSTPVSLEQPSSVTNNNLYVKSISELTSILPVINTPSTESNNIITPIAESNKFNKVEPIKDKINETVQTNINKTTLYDIEYEINKGFYLKKDQKKSYHDESSSDHYTPISTIIMPLNKETSNTVLLPKSKDEKTEHQEDDSDHVSSTEAIIITSGSDKSTPKLLLHKTLHDKEAQLSSQQSEDENEEDEEDNGSTLPLDSSSSTESIKMLLKVEEGKMPLLLTKDEKKGHHGDSSDHVFSTETIIRTSDNDKSTSKFFLQQTWNEENSDSTLSSYAGLSTESVKMILKNAQGKFPFLLTKDASKGNHVDNNDHVSSTETIIKTSANEDLTPRFLLHQILDDNETQDDENSDPTLPTDAGSSTEIVMMLLKEDEGKFPLLQTKDEKEGHNLNTSEPIISTENVISFFHVDDSKDFVRAPLNNNFESTSGLPLRRTKDEKKGQHVPNMDLIFYTDSAVIPSRYNESENDQESSDSSSSTNTLLSNDASTSEIPLFQDEEEVNDNNLDNRYFISPTNFNKIPSSLNEITNKVSLIEKTNVVEMQNVVNATDHVPTINTITFSNDEFRNKKILPDSKVTLEDTDTTDSSTFDDEPKIIAEIKGSTDPSVKLEETVDNGDETYEESEGGEHFLSPVKSSTEIVMMLLKEDEGKFPLLLTKDEKEGQNLNNSEPIMSTENVISSFHVDDSKDFVRAPLINNFESTGGLPLRRTKDEKKGQHVPNMDLIFYTDSAVIPLGYNESENDHESSDSSSSTNTLLSNDASTSEIPLFQDEEEVNDNNLDNRNFISPTNFNKIPSSLNEITNKVSLIEKTNVVEIQNVVNATDHVPTINTITFSSDEFPSKKILPDLKVTLEDTDTTDSSTFANEPKIIAEIEGSTDPSVKLEEIVDNGDETYVESEGGERFLSPVKKIIVTKSIHSEFDNSPKNEVDDSLVDLNDDSSSTNKNISNTANNSRNEITPTTVLSTESVR